jgi:DNA-directed RNA polymerase subunit RPC12/RpoP
MGKKFVKKDMNYGCFLAGYNCITCGKTVLTQNFSWESNKIGLGDVDKITDELDKTMKKKEINFCCKCGSKL